MQTIVELQEFIRKADGLLNEGDRLSTVKYLAAHLMSDALLLGTGGIRKLRWAAQGKGKNGGIRVIYYYHDERIPLFY